MSVTIGSKDHTIKTDEGVAINAELDTQTDLLTEMRNSVKELTIIKNQNKEIINLLNKIYR